MRSLILVAVLALTSAACDENGALTGPSSGGGRVEAVIRDSSLSQQASVTGTLSGNVFASVGNSNRWFDLGSPNGITVPLQQPVGTASTTVHGEQNVPAGSFDRVRLVFQGVTARLTRGSVVGGTTLTDDVTLTLGGSDAQAELTASVNSFSGEDAATTKRVVMFDLRSQAWLTAGALQSRRVEDAALQAALIATTRAEAR